ncbi:MAG: recombination mediator RecR [Verrucomicrobiota bacterium]|nr:recombination mediator RecR [Verrucomicrobiota bacterium]
MTSVYENLLASLKSLPGLGYRSAEKIAIHLLVERRTKLDELIELMGLAAERLTACEICGNLAEGQNCSICASTERDDSSMCIVETVTDLVAIEKAGVFKGKYHVLHGKLSPIRGIGPKQLNLDSLVNRLENNNFKEVILALGNDMEGEATCHFLRSELFVGLNLQVTRIGFGLPSGAGITYADQTTLKSALDSRKSIE